MKTTKEQWITLGYQIFAQSGPKGLKIERLARGVGKSKSSFYHLFADLDGFVQQLLTHHLQRAKVLAKLEANCKTEQEFIDVLVAHKTDLLFSRQLRFHRDQPRFEKCFLQVSQLNAPAIVGIWSVITGLTNHSHLAELIFKLSLDNFLLQITEDHLNPKWLTQYFKELRTLIRAFTATRTSADSLDGSV